LHGKDLFLSRACRRSRFEHALLISCRASRPSPSLPDGLVQLGFAVMARRPIGNESPGGDR